MNGSTVARSPHSFPCRCGAPTRGTLDNRVSAVYARLPIGVEDPVEALGAVREHMDDLKASGEVDTSGAIVGVGDFAPPVLAAVLARALVHGQEMVQTVLTMFRVRRFRCTCADAGCSRRTRTCRSRGTFASALRSGRTAASCSSASPATGRARGDIIASRWDRPGDRRPSQGGHKRGKLRSIGPGRRGAGRCSLRHARISGTSCEAHAVKHTPRCSTSSCSPATAASPCVRQRGLRRRVPFAPCEVVGVDRSCVCTFVPSAWDVALDAYELLPLRRLCHRSGPPLVRLDTHRGPQARIERAHVTQRHGSAHSHTGPFDPCATSIRPDGTSRSIVSGSSVSNEDSSERYGAHRVHRLARRESVEATTWARPGPLVVRLRVRHAGERAPARRRRGSNDSGGRPATAMVGTLEAGCGRTTARRTVPPTRA